GETWSEQQKLTASDGVAGQYFGAAVSLNGETALVGASESAYVFVRSGTIWSEQQKLTASDGVAGQNFGVAVSLSGESALVGADYDDSSYVFVRSGTSWSEQQKLTGSAGFGHSVSLSGESALVGTYGGSASVFVRSVKKWSEQQELTAPDATGRAFGASVSLSGESALVGADTTCLSCGDFGLAYVFVRSGTSWSQEQELVPPYRVDYFGSAVSLSGASALIGEPYGDSTDSYRGSAWVFGYGADNGEVCTLDDECGSGHCAEQVCCDAPCAAACLSCLAARKSYGSDGQCGPIRGGNDPKDACSVEPASTCGETGACDGAGACALHAEGTECAPSSCSSTTSIDAADTCDGAGTCVVMGTESCAGYLCVSSACTTSCEANSDCDSALGFECISGECKLPLAAPCSASTDCATGFCADGVCCDSDCTGQCEACAEPGSEGECVAVTGKPRPGRNPCDTFGDPSCARECDGEHRALCQFMPETATCDSSCADGSEVVSLCNGRGRCKVQAPSPCSPFVCGATACLEECASSDDCAAGYVCSSKKCGLPLPLSCSRDRSSSLTADGEMPCGAYQCDVVSGACRTNCAAISDCASGYACNSSNQQCEKATEAMNTRGGCGCRTAGSRGAGNSVLSALVALVALGFRRRRRQPGVRVS
ncbi:MAG TPA: FG-GAP repeat protein, partial [Polyangiaceae bacterium]|nr:FG-GAP repeat protein [Polyangiaceae bacterium]